MSTYVSESVFCINVVSIPAITDSMG